MVEGEAGLTWEEAVLRVLRRFHPREVELQTVYFEVGRHRRLSGQDLQITRYGEERYHHVVRATLNQLVKAGRLERIRRGVYALPERAGEERAGGGRPGGGGR